MAGVAGALSDIGGSAGRAAGEAGEALARSSTIATRTSRWGETIADVTLKSGRSFSIGLGRGSARGSENALQAFSDAIKSGDQAALDDLDNLSKAIKAAEDAKGNPRLLEIRGPDGVAVKGAAAGNWAQRARNFLGANYKPIIAGITVTSIVAAAGIYLNCTDQRVVNITNLKVVPNTSNTYIEVNYDQPGATAGCIDGTFRPRVNDTFKFTGTQTTPRLETFGECPIVQIKNGGSVVVQVPQEVTNIGTGTGGWGQATCTSCFENQFAGIFASIVTTVVAVVAGTASAAGAGAAEGLCSVMPALCNALGGVGSGLANLPMLILGFCCLISLCVAMFVLISKFS